MPSGVYKHKSKWRKILTKKFLIKEYINSRKSTTQIAKEVGCGNMAVYYWLKKFRIPIRTLFKAQKERCKNPKNSGNYKDGRCLKTYYCKDCEIEIHKDTTLYKQGKCRSCVGKGKKMSKETKEKIRLGNLGKHKFTKNQLKLMRNRITKHHIYGKKSKKVIKLKNRKHTQLHHNAYWYILEKEGKEGIDKYIEWFFVKYGEK